MLTPILEEDASERVLKIGIYNYRPSLERKSTQREILDSSGLLQSTSTCGTHSVLTTGFLLLLQSPAPPLQPAHHQGLLPWASTLSPPGAAMIRHKYSGGEPAASHPSESSLLLEELQGLALTQRSCLAQAGPAPSERPTSPVASHLH